jgi:hypothetical protein
MWESWLIQIQGSKESIVVPLCRASFRRASAGPTERFALVSFEDGVEFGSGTFDRSMLLLFESHANRSLSMQYELFANLLCPTENVAHVEIRVANCGGFTCRLFPWRWSRLEHDTPSLARRTTDSRPIWCFQSFDR